MSSVGTVMPKVIGVGTICMDTLVVVDHYPQPDEKLRTKSHKVMPGGNTGNVLSNLSHGLQVPCLYVGNIANDTVGEQLIQSFQQDGVAVGVSREGTRSGSSYIIIDAQQNTRTILHTPPDHDVTEKDLIANITPQNMESSCVVFSDGRYPLAVVPFFAHLDKLVQSRNSQGLPFVKVVEAENCRDGTLDLIHLADILLLSPAFLTAYGKVHQLPTDLITLQFLMLQRQCAGPQCNYLVTTLGTDGCIVLVPKSKN